MTARVFKAFKTQKPVVELLPGWLRWADGIADTVVLLHSNGYRKDKYTRLPWILGIGSGPEYRGTGGKVFEELREFSNSCNDWMFGFFSYELKNQLERLSSKNPDYIGMPLCHFFSPGILIYPMGKYEIMIGSLVGEGEWPSPEGVFGDISGIVENAGGSHHKHGGKIRQRVNRKKYIDRVRDIRAHIQAGDIYEMNYCIEFFSEHASADPLMMYQKLNDISLPPFSCFYKLSDKYLVSASPERFLKKTGNGIISQPVKGTGPRGKDHAEDKLLREKLYNDPKERSENVMIVDLVRNDLARTAQKDSVKVEELFGIYSFRQLNHMISTVTSTLGPEHDFIDAIKNAFPMGSMTGAPKHSAMKLIDLYEDTCRGLYSGSVGYISPEKDFDLNVVIRSILYNKKNNYLSFMAGSAITIGSDPEREYEECLLKAKAMAEASGFDF